MPLAVENLRNIIIIGGQGVGKTILVEAMLYQAGIITKMGSVQEGSTVCDYDSIEKERGFTINPSLVHFPWNNKKINVLDTPGFGDFLDKTKAILKAVEGAIVVVSPSNLAGNEMKRLWEYTCQDRLPHLIFLNKIDEGEMNFQSILEKIEKEIDETILPLQIPLLKEGKVERIIDLIENKSIIYQANKASSGDILPQMDEQLAPFREKIIDAAAETDDALITKYLETGKLSKEEIKKGLREGFSKANFVPLVCGSALKNNGVELLLDTVVNLFPSPRWRDCIKGKTPQGEEVERKIGPEEPFLSLVFLSLAETHLGEVNFLKVYSGTLSSGSNVYNVSTGENVKIGQIYLVQGNKREEVPELGTGDIGILTKLKNTSIGNVFSDQEHFLILPPLEFPEPTTSIALKCKNEKDEQKLSAALSKLVKVDPILRVEVDKESAQTILSGMGEVHLEVTINRIRKEFNVEIETEEPRVPYRETISTPAEAQGRYKKQTGGRGQFGDVWLRIKPLPRGERFKFVDKIKGGSVPNRFIPSVEKGVKAALKKGFLSSYPMVDIEITLFDGSYHSVDSSDIAFQVAGSMSLKNAVEKANPIMLEPIAQVEVEIPSEFLGEINGDLNSRRGRILEIQPLGSREKIKAYVPVAEMHNYSTRLRSLTQGSGIFRKRFSHYEKLPEEISQRIIAQAKEKKKKD